MGVFCDRLNLGSTAALDCWTGQNDLPIVDIVKKSSDSYSSRCFIHMILNVSVSIFIQKSVITSKHVTKIECTLEQRTGFSLGYIISIKVKSVRIYTFLKGMEYAFIQFLNLASSFSKLDCHLMSCKMKTVASKQQGFLKKRLTI